MTTQTTSAPSTPLVTTDPRELFTAAAATARATIAAVMPSQMSLPTPCGSFDVHMLLGHLIPVVHRTAILAEGGDPFSLPDIMESSATTDFVGEWDTAMARFVNAWADPAVLETMMILPWAQLPGGAMLSMYTSEISVHTWDLASATGQHPTWNDDALAVALFAMQQTLPAEGRIAAFDAIRANMPGFVDQTDFAYPFAEAVATPSGAPLIDQLVAWTGRRPG